jgi:hypothetical protein
MPRPNRYECALGEGVVIRFAAIRKANAAGWPELRARSGADVSRAGEDATQQTTVGHSRGMPGPGIAPRPSPFMVAHRVCLALQKA